MHISTSNASYSHINHLLLLFSLQNITTNAAIIHINLRLNCRCHNYNQCNRQHISTLTGIVYNMFSRTLLLYLLVHLSVSQEPRCSSFAFLEQLLGELVQMESRVRALLTQSCFFTVGTREHCFCFVFVAQITYQTCFQKIFTMYLSQR